MPKHILVGIILLLGACSPLDLFKLPTVQTANDQAVSTGAIINKDTQKSIIEDSPNSKIHTDTGRYHLEAKDNLTVNVYETSSWILPTLLTYILGRPLLLKLVQRLLLWRKKRNDR